MIGARPILTFLRGVVHEDCPVCGIAAFREHCTFGFWKGTLFVDAGDRPADAMGQFGRIRTPKPAGQRT